MKEITVLSLWYRIQSIFAVRHPNHIWCDNRHYIDKYSGISASNLHRYKAVCSLDECSDIPMILIKKVPREHKEVYK